MAEWKKRYELKVLTSNTVMEGLSTPENCVRKAKQLGLAGVAVTDRMSVSGLAEWHSAAKAFGIAGFYGIEAMVENDWMPEDFHQRFTVSLLAKNPDGLRAIYRLLSACCRKKSGGIRFSEILAVRENLLLGSACGDGIFFHHVLGNARAESFMEAAELFDYLEVCPTMDKELVKVLVTLGEHLDIPVTAVSDSRYIVHAQYPHYQTLCSGNALKSVKPEDKPLLAPGSLLRQFAYLGEETAEKLVYDNTVRVAEQLTAFAPVMVSGGTLPFSESVPIRELLDQALRIRYDDTPPDFVTQRYRQELAGFEQMALWGNLQTLYAVSSQSDVYCTTSYGASFLAYLLGVSRVNPLPGHIRCMRCGAITPLSGKNARTTLQTAACPQCGTECPVEGYDLPFSDFMSGGDHNRLYLNTAQVDAKAVQTALTGLLGEAGFARVGNCRVMPFSRFRRFYRQLFCEHEEVLPPLPREESFDSLSSLNGGMSIFDRTQAQYLLVPQGENVSLSHITAVCREAGGSAVLTAFDAGDMDEYRLPMLRIDQNEALYQLVRLEMQSRQQIMPDTNYRSEAMQVLCDREAQPFRWLPEGYAGYLMKLSEYFPLTSYEQLIRVVSVGHGSHLWVQNFDRLVQNGTVSPRDVFTCCEELQRLLQNAGMDADEAESLTQAVRFCNGAAAVDQAMEQKLLGLGLPDWLPDSLRRIRSLPCRAYAIAEADILCRLIWYYLHDRQLYRKIVR